MNARYLPTRPISESSWGRRGEIEEKKGWKRTSARIWWNKNWTSEEFKVDWCRKRLNRGMYFLGKGMNISRTNSPRGRSNLSIGEKLTKSCTLSLKMRFSELDRLIFMKLNFMMIEFQFIILHYLLFFIIKQSRVYSFLLKVKITTLVSKHPDLRARKRVHLLSKSVCL